MLQWAIKHVACQGWRLLPPVRRISTAATCVARTGRGRCRSKVVEGGRRGGRNKFSRQMNSRLALLSAQKATETRTETVKKQFPVPAACSFQKDKSRRGGHKTPESNPLGCTSLQVDKWIRRWILKKTCWRWLIFFVFVLLPFPCLNQFNCCYDTE